MTWLTRKWRWWLAWVTLAMIVLIFPLSVVVALTGLPSAGLATRAATGTLWDGRLYQASIAGLAVGDTQVGLRVLPLFLARIESRLVAPRLTAVAQVSPGGWEVRHATGSVEPGDRLGPIARLDFDDARIGFSGKRCSVGEGRVRASLTMQIGGVALPGGFSGMMRCEGSELLLPLVGQSGLERLSVFIDADGKWRATLNMRTTDLEMQRKLDASGMARGPEGYTMRLSGRL